MPPKGAPNVLLIITDDAGFDVPSTFGGDANQWQPNLFRNTTQIYPFRASRAGTWSREWLTMPSTI
jgi:arylsulfatase A-like enzyme